MINLFCYDVIIFYIECIIIFYMMINLFYYDDEMMIIRVMPKNTLKTKVKITPKRGIAKMTQNSPMDIDPFSPEFLVEISTWVPDKYREYAENTPQKWPFFRSRLYKTPPHPTPRFLPRMYHIHHKKSVVSHYGFEPPSPLFDPEFDPLFGHILRHFFNW